MRFNLRRSERYATCSIEDCNTTIDLGMLNREEAKQLLEDFRAAVDDLELFLNVADKEQE